VVVETGTEGMEDDLRRGEVVSVEPEEEADKEVGTDEVEAEASVAVSPPTFFMDSSMLFLESSR
jgi:hypothetical protein